MIPIIMTAYNRLDTLKKTLDSLFGCDGIERRPILVYIDGGKDEDDKCEVDWVRRFLLTGIIPQYSLVITCSKKHLGLRGNSLRAINESLKKYDKIIFIQDDMEFSRDFLTFMDWALNKFEDRENIMFVSGYSHIDYHSSYLSPLIADGLGIWKNKYFVDDVPIYEPDKKKIDYEGFANYSTPMFASYLRDIITGKSDSFMIWFAYYLYIHRASCLHPGINKLRYMVSDSTNSKKKDSKKLNNVLYNEFNLDESNTAYNIIKQTKNYKWSLMKRFMRWLRNALNSLL